MYLLQIVVILFSPILLCRGLCPLTECECDNIDLRVDCHGMTLQEIPITLNPHIQTLQIRQGQLKRLDASLQFYPHLKVLDLGSNIIESIPPLCFMHQQGLTNLHLANNSINFIDTQAFVGLSNLTFLSLSSNSLSSLEQNQFSSLVNLRELDVSRNRITFISSETFEGLTRLESLHLEMNRLTAIPLNPLMKLKGLKSLFLAHNTLHASTVNLLSVDKTATALSNLNLIDLSYSHLARMELCHILDLTRNLKHLVFVGNSPEQLACIESNNINILEIGDMESLTRLDPVIFYSMGKLSTVKMRASQNLVTISQDVFIANTDLEHIEITDNPLLEEISLASFAFLPKLRMLSLANNSLISIHVDNLTNQSLKRFEHLSELDISNNPLDCNCTIKSLVSHLKQDILKCHTVKSAIEVFHLGNLVTGDLTCISPHTVKVLCLGTLTIVIITVVAVSVAVHLVHFRRSKNESFVKVDNSNLFMTFRHPNSKVVTEDLIIHPTLTSSLAWNEAMSQADLKVLDPEGQPQDQKGSICDNGHLTLQPDLYHQHHHQQQHHRNHQTAEPLYLMNLYSSAPYQCNYAYPYRNWS